MNVKVCLDQPDGGFMMMPCRAGRWCWCEWRESFSQNIPLCLLVQKSKLNFKLEKPIQCIRFQSPYIFSMYYFLFILSICKAKKYEDIFLQMLMHHVSCWCFSHVLAHCCILEELEVKIPPHGIFFCTNYQLGFSSSPSRSDLQTVWCHDCPDHPTKKSKKKKKKRKKKEGTQRAAWDQDFWPALRKKGRISNCTIFLSRRSDTKNLISKQQNYLCRVSTMTILFFWYMGFIFFTSGILTWDLLVGLELLFEKEKRKKQQSYTDVS